MKIPSVMLPALLFSVMTSCTSSDLGEVEQIPDMTFSVVDSLGVAYGDTTQMYGNIAGACFITPDRFVVMDNAMEVVFLYTRQGELLDSHDYQGSGPLEITYGGFLAPMRDGFALFDSYLPKCVIFDSDMTPRRGIVLEETMWLLESCVVIDSSIVSCIYSTRQQDDEVEFGMDVCRWNASGERVVDYCSRYFPMSGAIEEMYNSYTMMEFCVIARSSGEVFISPDRSDFRIYSFSADGTCIDTLQSEHVRDPRSELEIQLELEFRRKRDRTLGSWSPSELEPGITQLQLQDSLGMLWVCHGSYLNPEFDVLSLQGELLFSATCEGLPGDELLRFSITDHGYLAYSIDPLEYPKLYILELDER